MFSHLPKEEAPSGAPSFFSEILSRLIRHKRRVSLGLEEGGGKRYASCRLRPKPQGMVHIVLIKAGGLDFLRGQVLGKLMDDGRDDLHVGKFLGAHRRIGIAHQRNVVKSRV